MLRQALSAFLYLQCALVAQSELVQDHIAALIQTQATALDLSFCDAASYYDMLHRLVARAFLRQSPLIVMDSGRIVESGAHAELVTNGGRYAQSWQMQMRRDGKY